MIYFIIEFFVFSFFLSLIWFRVRQTFFFLSLWHRLKYIDFYHFSSLEITVPSKKRPEPTAEPSAIDKFYRSVVIKINTCSSFILMCTHFKRICSRYITNGPGDLGSIPGRVIPKTLKMVLDTSLLNTRQ